MIKVAELRIGNLINHKIEGITKVDVMSYSGNEDDRVNDFALKFYEGIPLNEEWLLKFGFHSGWGSNPKHLWKIKYQDIFGLHIRSEKILYNTDTRVELQYVHQLQNLYFALTGEELTLNSQPIKK